METRGVKDFNEMMQEFQQQFRCYKEKADERFKVI